ncbi:hypothetical protein [Mesobacillus foraminis]|uniref:hypothetical protein n=1 Tax=Mesobacillus foraminis TaxID=279826 RepID=UPI000EF46332|nr:hypothetical protein [Mesobacillus foraminis]
MFKKILSAVVAVTIVFSPIGNSVFQELQQQTEVSAKRYKSGTKRYNNNSRVTNPDNNQNNTVNRNTNTTNRTATRNNGGMMRGLMYGGLAGLLFGGLLAGMGGLAPILGMAINIIGILLAFMLISRIISAFKRNRQQEDRDQWRR